MTAVVCAVVAVNAVEMIVCSLLLYRMARAYMVMAAQVSGNPHVSERPTRRSIISPYKRDNNGGGGH